MERVLVFYKDYFFDFFDKQTENVKKKIRIKLNMGRPDSAKACTDVSPKIPVLVKKVE